MADIDGMFNRDSTYFANSPVVIRIKDISWTKTSPFYVVRVVVVNGSKTVGDFHADTGDKDKTSIEFDISSALRSIWAGYDFADEVARAQEARDYIPTVEKPSTVTQSIRSERSYNIRVSLEYIDDGAVQVNYIIRDGSTLIPAGRCVLGGMTEWERSLLESSAFNLTGQTNIRFGNASTKPLSSPEHVGRDSITSWVGIVGIDMNTIGYYYSSAKVPGTDSYSAHAPKVLRDSQPYVDFLFLNRRGAIETCSGLTKEAMDIALETKQYGRVEGPSFKPSRSIMAIGSDGRRSWNMSSGYVTSDWAEWWAMEFLGGKRKRWWMLYKGSYVPVIVEPAKKSTTVYDRSKQNMPHVDFTVTLALEG